MVIIIFLLQITGEAMNGDVEEELPLENENGLIDIDKLSPIHGTPTKSCVYLVCRLFVCNTI